MSNIQSSSLQLNVECDALESLLNYAYTGECTLTSENVHRIMHAARLCEMTNLLQYCCEYLMNNLNDKNIFHLYHFAKTHSNPKFLSVTYEYLM